MSRLLNQLLGATYRDEANGGDAGSAAGAGGAGDAGAGAAGDKGDDKSKAAPAGDQGAAGDKGAGAGAGESLVAQARRAAQGAAAPTIPDKFIVKNAAGEVDHKATLDKLYPSYTDLEAKLGAHGLPAPAKADDYKLELREGEKELPKVDEKMNAKFRAKAHEMGLNQAQYNNMVRAGNEMIGEILEQASGVSQAAARATLVTHYGSEKAFEAAAGRAYQAFAAYADATDMAEIDSIGDFPVFIRVFDRVRADMREDRVPNFNTSAAATEAAEIEQLQNGDREKSPYWNPKLAGHAAAVERVRAFHERQVAQKNAKLG